MFWWNHPAPDSFRDCGSFPLFVGLGWVGLYVWGTYVALAVRPWVLRRSPELQARLAPPSALRVLPLLAAQRGCPCGRHCRCGGSALRGALLRGVACSCDLRPTRPAASHANQRRCPTPVRVRNLSQGARVRAFIVAGIMVGPFFPASNVLFYVGTYVAERLLYFPSIGFCMLARALNDASAQRRTRSTAQAFTSTRSGERAQFANSEGSTRLPEALINPPSPMRVSYVTRRSESLVECSPGLCRWRSL